MRNIVITHLLFSLLLFFTRQVYADVLYDEQNAAVSPAIHATKLTQPLKYVAGAVTVITREEIQALGYKNIPDILRSVPGFRVTTAGQRNAHISYHGTSAAHPRRMFVAIDDVPILTGDFNAIHWSKLPINLNQIERIIIHRGPNGTTYGDNAFLASINFVRRHVEDTAGHGVNFRMGSIDTKEVSYQYGSKFINTQFSMALHHKKNEGADYRGETGQIPYLDKNEVDMLTWKSETLLNPRNKVITNVALLQSKRSPVAGPAIVSTSDIKTKGYNYSVKWEHMFKNSLRLDVSAEGSLDDEDWYFKAQLPVYLYLNSLASISSTNFEFANALASFTPYSGNATSSELASAAQFQADLNALGPSAFIPVRSNVNLDRRSKVNILNAELLWKTKKHRSVFGFSYSNSYSNSDSYLNGEVDYDVMRGFVESHYNLDKFSLNMGGLLQKHDAVDGLLYAYKLGLNYHYHPNYIFKIFSSKSFRAPSAIEADRYWVNKNEFLDPLPPTAVFNDAYYNLNASRSQVKEEVIHSTGISFLADIERINMTLDVKAFYDEIARPIIDPVFTFIEPENGDDYALTGYEYDLTWQPREDIKIKHTYSYLTNNSKNIYERSLHGKHAGMFSLTKNWSSELQTTLAYYGNSKIGGFSYDRFDVAVSKKFRHVPGLHVGLLHQWNNNTNNGATNAWELGPQLGRFKNDHHFFINIDYQF